MTLFIIILVLLAGLGIWGFSMYNGFVRSRNLIQESWRQIDVELNRRYELIPNLVETVRGYAAHERNTLEEVTRLRNLAASLGQSHAASEQRGQVEEQLSGAIRQLIVSVESYPELKSNVNFLELQRELTETEDRIAAGRRFYNANVRDYNTRIDTVPSNIIAGWAKFEKATYFQVDDPAVRQAPNVNFGEISQRPAGQSQLPDPNAYQQNAPIQAPPMQQPQAQPGYQPQQGYPQQGYQQPQPGYQPPQAGNQPPMTPPSPEGYQQPGGYNPPQ